MLATVLTESWIERTFVVLVDRLAKERGFLSIWSADPSELNKLCVKAQSILNEIVYADEEYQETNLDLEAVEAMENYRLRVSLALQDLRDQIAARNQVLARRLQKKAEVDRRTAPDLVVTNGGSACEKASSILSPICRSDVRGFV